MTSDTDNRLKKVLFKSKFFQVNQVEVEHKGRKFTKDIIQRRDFILVVALTAQDEIYLVTQYRDALQKLSLEIVAGQLEENEDPLEGAKRELKEEAGLSAQKWQQIGTYYVSANMIGKGYIFLATDLTQGEASLDDDEDIATIKMPFSEAIEKIISGEIDVASNVAALLLVDKLKSLGKI